MRKIFLLLFFVIFSCFIGISAPIPGWLWAKHTGGNGDDRSISMNRDASGNLYVTGVFHDTIYFGNDTLMSAGYADVFIGKYDSTGNPIWARSFGGSGNDGGMNITTDISGNVYITGGFNSDTMIVGGNMFMNGGNGDVFIAKYDSLGTLLWIRTSGGTEQDYGAAVTTDLSGNSYLTGQFISLKIGFETDTLINTKTDIDSVSSNVTADIFIVKYDPNGHVVWAKKAGGFGDEWPTSVSNDAAGNFYVGGYFRSDTLVLGSTLLINPDTINLPEMLFIIKYDPSGNIIWAKGTNGGSGQFLKSIYCDASSNFYITGLFGDTSVTFDAITLFVNGNNDMFTVKYDSSGNVLWAKRAGGKDQDEGEFITTDAFGNVFVLGVFDSDTIIFENDTVFRTGPYLLATDFFVVKYDLNGNVLWAKGGGSSFSEWSAGIAVDENGKVYLTGAFYEPTIFGSDTLVNTGNGDIFIACLDKTCSAGFTCFPDVIPHNWIVVNLAIGGSPLSYTWNWGDGNTSNSETPSHVYSSPGNYQICLSIVDANGCSDSYCDSTYLTRLASGSAIITVNVVNSITGVSEPTTNENVPLIYPNPAKDNIIFESNSTNYYFELFDVTGDLIMKKIITNAKFEIDLTRFNSGVYFLTVGDNEKQIHRKIIKE